MNILFVGCSSCWHTAEWINFFAEEHSVILFSDKKVNLPKQSHDQRISVIESSGLLGWLSNFFRINSSKFRHLNKFISLYFFRYKIMKILKEYNIDVIHAHSLYYGYLSSFQNKIPLVFTPMGSDIIIAAQKIKYYRKMAQRAFKFSTVITGDSKLLQKKGYEIGASISNNYIIQNGVDSTKFYPFSTQIKHNLGLQSDDLLLFSPRALDPNYNIDVIIDALALLKDRVDNFKCIFAYAFGGEYFKSLVVKTESLGLTKNIHWLGFTKYQDMPLYYNAADIVISIPTSDSSPKSVYESMFCSSSVIVSDIDWVYEILDAEDCVVKINHRDPKSLASSITNLYLDKEKRSHLERKSLRVAKKHFDYKDNMLKMSNIIEMKCL